MIASKERKGNQADRTQYQSIRGESWTCLGMPIHKDTAQLAQRGSDLVCFTILIQLRFKQMCDRQQTNSFIQSRIFSVNNLSVYGWCSIISTFKFVCKVVRRAAAVYKNLTQL